MSGRELRVLVDQGQCVRSGFCCMQGPCPFGEWDEAGERCKHLGGDAPGEHACLIHDEIVKHPYAYASPAFGGGCCSPLFNDRRETVIRKMIEEVDS